MYAEGTIQLEREEVKPAEARFYEKQKDSTVLCSLCNRRCRIADGGFGFCKVRKNTKGILHTLAYGKTLTMSIDPIEKKPLFNFMPGTQCMGVSTYGCNFTCLHCQNSEISQGWTAQALQAVPYTDPEEIVRQTLNAEIGGIAYTYTEPTIFTEYALDTMRIARENGLYNVWVSNGYMTREAANEIAPLLDAINIDLKGDARFYKEVCGNADIKHVKENIVRFHKKGVHVEVTNLIVPGYNDKDEQVKAVAEFIAGISPEMPLHFSAFSPQWKLNYLAATSPSAVHKARHIAEKAGLKYVYTGNIAGEENITKCKSCGSTLIFRHNYFAEFAGLKDGGKSNKCEKCGVENNIIV